MLIYHVCLCFVTTVFYKSCWLLVTSLCLIMSASSGLLRINLVLGFFFLRFYLFVHERGRDIGRGRSRLLPGGQCGTPSQTSIMLWAEGRCSTTATQASHSSRFLLCLRVLGTSWRLFNLALFLFLDIQWILSIMILWLTCIVYLVRVE